MCIKKHALNNTTNRTRQQKYRVEGEARKIREKESKVVTPRGRRVPDMGTHGDVNTETGTRIKKIGDKRHHRHGSTIVFFLAGLSQPRWATEE